MYFTHEGFVSRPWRRRAAGGRAEVAASTGLRNPAFFLTRALSPGPGAAEQLADAQRFRDLLVGGARGSMNLAAVRARAQDLRRSLDQIAQGLAFSAHNIKWCVHPPAAGRPPRQSLARGGAPPCS